MALFLLRWHNHDKVAEKWHDADSVAEIIERAPVRIGPQGRLVIPARLRRRLGLRSGQTLMARAEDGRLVLERPAAILARLKARFKSIPPDVSLVDDLIRDRRQESRREGRR